MELYYVHRPTIAIFKIYTSVISIRTSMKDWLLSILNEEKRNPENYFCVCSVKIIFLQFLPHFENNWKIEEQIFSKQIYCKMYNWNIYFHFFLSLAILLYYITIYGTKTINISWRIFFKREFEVLEQQIKIFQQNLKLFSRHYQICHIFFIV